MHTLRPYQQDTVDAHYVALQEPGANPLFVLPTASGKSLVIAEFCKRSILQWPDTRILVLAHVRELLEQNHDELMNHLDGADISTGIYSAGIGRRDTTESVIFAGIQSAAHKDEMHQHWNLVLIDECHRVNSKTEGRYRDYLAELQVINPSIRVVGYTATHYRLDGGYLHKGKDALFTGIGYTVPVEMLVCQGYLSTLRCKQPEHQIDTSGCKTRQGDWVTKDLSAAAMEGENVRLAVGEAVRIAREEKREHWLAFAVDIAHALEIQAQLDAHGVTAECVFGHTPKDERDSTTARFKAGELPCLINVGCLTTGFNATLIDCLMVLRPTKSTSLYVQIYGRGMRLHEGKEDCLVIDFGGNVTRHGPINRVAIEETGDKVKPGEAPVKVCPECSEVVPLGAKECPECQYVWPVSEKHDTVAGTAQPIDMGPAPKPQKMRVSSMTARKWTKQDKPPSMRVDYMVGLTQVSEWVCFEHGGFAASKASDWWCKLGAMPVPLTVDEALGRVDELTVPSHALVGLVGAEGKYKRIVAVMTDDETAVKITAVIDKRPARLQEPGPLPF